MRCARDWQTAWERGYLYVALASIVPLGAKVYNLAFKGAHGSSTQNPLPRPHRLARWSQRIGLERIAHRALPKAEPPKGRSDALHEHV